MNKNGKKLENIASILVFVVTLAIIAVTHVVVPYMMDDLWYSTNLTTDQPIASLRDIWESQVWHYLNWGGRSLTHTILQLTILCGETINNILNVVFTVLLSVVIFVVSLNLAGVKVEGGQRNNFEKPSGKIVSNGATGANSISAGKGVFYLSLIMGMLHGLNANWMMSMYWQSGSANYLYITVFILLFVYCYLRELPDVSVSEGTNCILKLLRGRVACEPKEVVANAIDVATANSVKNLPGINLWIIPLAILTGWSNENMGPTAWLLSVFVIAYMAISHRKIKAWMILGSVFSLLGSAACILAPGNFVRSAMVDTDKALWWKLLLRGYSEGRAGIDYLYPSLILLLGLATIFYAVLKNSLDFKSVVLMAMSVISWGAMVLSPHYPDRATFGTLAINIVLITSLFIRIQRKSPSSKWWLNVMAILVWMRGMFWLLEYLGCTVGIIT